MNEKEILENRLTLLENSVLSLNTMWKLSILMQGPSFADAAIKNLETALSENPNDSIVQSAVDDLKEAMEAWKDETGGSFGFEDTIRKNLDGLFGRITAIQFVLFLNILQNGVEGLEVMSKTIENRRMRKDIDVSEAFKGGSNLSFEYFLMEIKNVVKNYQRTEDKEVSHG